MGTALLSTVPLGPAGAAFSDGTDLFISAERSITDNVGSPSDCTPSQITADAAARVDVDAQNDPWEATAAARGLTVVRPATIPVPADPDRVDLSPTPLAVPGSTVTIGASYRNVPYADIAAYTPAALGSPAVGTDPNSGAAPHSYRNPYTPIPNDGTLQDCSPYPASLYDTSPTSGVQPARQWNALYGSGSELDGALFEFSAPVAAFGAWFGDLETRPGTPAYVKLIADDNTVLWEGPVPASIGPNPTSAQCGGSNTATDPLACGNQTTRWIGFVTQPGDPLVKRMLVTVGDDDDCTQVAPSQCDASTEHFGWVGAMIAEPDPLATTTTTSTTTTSTTSTTTSTTTVPPTTVPPTTTSTTTTSTTTSTTAAPATTSTTLAPAVTTPPQERPSTPSGVDALRGERPPAAPVADIEAARFTPLAFTGPGPVDRMALAATGLIVLGVVVRRTAGRRTRRGEGQRSLREPLDAGDGGEQVVRRYRR